VTYFHTFCITDILQMCLISWCTFMTIALALIIIRKYITYCWKRYGGWWILQIPILATPLILKIWMYGVFQCNTHESCYNLNRIYKLDVRGSVHHSTVHMEKSNKMQQCIKMYYSIFIWSSTSFGRHTAHHQEPKTALAVSGFANMKGCLDMWLLDADSVQQPSMYAKPETASAVLGSWWRAVYRPKNVELHTNME
jgi:hypothetical protein